MEDCRHLPERVRVARGGRVRGGRGNGTFPECGEKRLVRFFFGSQECEGCGVWERRGEGGRGG